MNDLSKKKVGDPVYGLDGSVWEVTEKDSGDARYPLIVVQGDESAVITDDGRFYMWLPPTFFSEPVRIVPAQGECDFSGYEVGDEVYDSDGFTRYVDEVESCGLLVNGLGMLTFNGQYNGEQMIFHAPPNPVASNPDAFKVPAHIAERKKVVDWEKVPIDTLVEVTFNKTSGWHKRYFAGWRFGNFKVFPNGATSKTHPVGMPLDSAAEIRLAEGGAE